MRFFLFGIVPAKFVVPKFWILSVFLLAVSDRRLSTPNMENYQVCIAYIVYNLFSSLECGTLAWCYRSGFTVLQYLVRSKLLFS